MGIESLYSAGIEDAIQRQIANPVPEGGASFSLRSVIAAGMKGVPRGALEAGGSVADILAPSLIESQRHPKPAVLADQPDDSVRRSNDLQLFGGGGDPARAKAAEFAPDPATATAADQLLHGLTRVGTKVAIASAAPGGTPVAATLLGIEGTNTAYHELIAQGVDPETAMKVAAVQGAGQAAAVAPMVGVTIAKTGILSVASGPGAFMAQEAMSRKILATAGYHDEASRHDPLDPLGLTVATLLPAVIGGVHAVGLARKPAPTLADVVLSNESGGKRYGTDGQLLTSPKGAQGEMQVMPGTATDPGFGVIPAKDHSPEELARVGRDYLDAMQHRYGSPDLAMAAYNAGPGAVDKALNAHGADWLAHLPEETQQYVEKGMKKLGDQTVAHASTDPVAVDAARVRVTNDALHRSMPDDIEAPAEVMRASDSIAEGEMPRVKPFGEIEPEPLHTEAEPAPIARDEPVQAFHGVEPEPSQYGKAVNEVAEALKTKDPGELLGELKTSGQLSELVNNALVGAADAGGNAARLKNLVAHAEEIGRNNPLTHPADVMAAAVERVRNGQPVTKPSEAAAKTDQARVDAMAVEHPDMRVILPGHDLPMSLTEAMDSARHDADFIRSESNLVQAAIACALSAGGA